MMRPHSANVRPSSRNADNREISADDLSSFNGKRIGVNEGIVQGPDYECIEELLGKMKDHNTKAARTGGIVVACGMAKHENDASVAPVFERADQSMYENKSDLKDGRIAR